MDQNDPSVPAGQVGALDMPWSEIPAGTVLEVLNFFPNNRSAVAIRHPEHTVSCADKLEMFARHPDLYSPYGEIRVARAAVMLVKRKQGQSHALHISDSDDRIDWKELKRTFNLSKKEDVRMFDGNVEEIVGLPLGGVSPLVSAGHKLNAIYFDRALHERELRAPQALWDFAFGTDVSLLVRPDDLVRALGQIDAVRELARWMPLHF